MQALFSITGTSRQEVPVGISLYVSARKWGEVTRCNEVQVSQLI